MARYQPYSSPDRQKPGEHIRRPCRSSQRSSKSFEQTAAASVTGRKTGGLMLVMPVLMALLFTTILLPGPAAAQQASEYERLRQQSRSAQAYIDYNVFPASEPGKTKVMVNFRLFNNHLQFRRVSDPDRPDRQFRSNVEINFDFYESDGDQAPRPLRRQQDRPRGSFFGFFGRSDQPERRVDDNPHVGHRFWSETLYAENYEQTRSNELSLQSHVIKELAPGHYDVTPVLADGRRERRVPPRHLYVPSFDRDSTAVFYFLDRTGEMDEPEDSPLVNLGRDVRYARDYHVLFTLPGHTGNERYELKISRLGNVSDLQEMQSGGETVFSHELPDDRVYENIRVEPDEDAGAAGLRITGAASVHGESGNPNEAGASNTSRDSASQDTGMAYGLMHIPNREFRNDRFRMDLYRLDINDDRELIGRRFFRNFWLNMPVSLLSLDMAIDKLRFIVDSDMLEQMKSGNRQEREENFRDFWDERDPSPDTEYNELMVEYYRRIDHTYEEFTEPQTPGFETDRGRIYIRHGEPDNVQRRLPAGEQTTEIWSYADREFVFVATSGFGEYELVEER